MELYLKLIIIIGAILLFLLIIYMAFMYKVFLAYAKRTKETSLLDLDLSKTHYAPYIEKINKNINEAVRLEYEDAYITSFDNLKLYAKFYRGNSDKYVILVHGYKATPYNNFATQLLSFLKHDFNVLLIYQRAHGESEGKYITFGVNEARDLDLWIRYLEDNKNAKKIILYGTSMGAATVILSDAKYPHDTVKLLVDDCGFDSLYNMIKLTLKPKHIMAFMVAPMVNLYYKIFSKISFIKDAPIKYINDIKKPIIFIHSNKDNMVFYEEGKNMSDAYKNNKLVIHKENAGHTSVFLANEDEIEPIFYDFIDKYI